MLIASESLTGNVLFAVQALSTIASCSNANRNLAQQKSISPAGLQTLRSRLGFTTGLGAASASAAALPLSSPAFSVALAAASPAVTLLDQQMIMKLYYGANSEVHGKIGVK